MALLENTAKVAGPKVVKPKKTGVRELSKQESQHKIMTAARHLFAELGYDRATLREIATRAGFTVGALFNHVTDKRDLIYLIFNEEVDSVLEIALASPRPYQTLSGKLLSITEHYFRLFANEPVLSRILLSEVVVETPGLHLDRYQSSRDRLIKGMQDLVEEAQKTGELRRDEDCEFIARHLFFALASALRWWLGSTSRPEWRNGHKQYERLLHLQMIGLLRERTEETPKTQRGRATTPSKPIV